MDIWKGILPQNPDGLHVRLRRRQAVPSPATEALEERVVTLFPHLHEMDIVRSVGVGDVPTSGRARRAAMQRFLSTLWRGITLHVPEHRRLAIHMVFGHLPTLAPLAQWNIKDHEVWRVRHAALCERLARLYPDIYDATWAPPLTVPIYIIAGHGAHVPPITPQNDDDDDDDDDGDDAAKLKAEALKPPAEVCKYLAPGWLLTGYFLQMLSYPARSRVEVAMEWCHMVENATVEAPMEVLRACAAAGPGVLEHFFTASPRVVVPHGLSDEMWRAVNTVLNGYLLETYNQRLELAGSGVASDTPLRMRLNSLTLSTVVCIVAQYLCARMPETPEAPRLATSAALEVLLFAMVDPVVIGEAAHSDHAQMTATFGRYREQYALLLRAAAQLLRLRHDKIDGSNEDGEINIIPDAELVGLCNLTRNVQYLLYALHAQEPQTAADSIGDEEGGGGDDDDATTVHSTRSSDDMASRRCEDALLGVAHIERISITELAKRAGDRGRIGLLQYVLTHCDSAHHIAVRVLPGAHYEGPPVYLLPNLLATRDAMALETLHLVAQDSQCATPYERVVQLLHPRRTLVVRLEEYNTDAVACDCGEQYLVMEKRELEYIQRGYAPYMLARARHRMGAFCAHVPLAPFMADVLVHGPPATVWYAARTIESLCTRRPTAIRPVSQRETPVPIYEQTYWLRVLPLVMTAFRSPACVYYWIRAGTHSGTFHTYECFQRFLVSFMAVQSTHKAPLEVLDRVMIHLRDDVLPVEEQLCASGAATPKDFEFVHKSMGLLEALLEDHEARMQRLQCLDFVLLPADQTIGMTTVAMPLYVRLCVLGSLIARWNWHLQRVPIHQAKEELGVSLILSIHLDRRASQRKNRRPEDVNHKLNPRSVCARAIGILNKAWTDDAHRHDDYANVYVRAMPEAVQQLYSEDGGGGVHPIPEHRGLGYRLLRYAIGQLESVATVLPHERFSKIRASQPIVETLDRMGDHDPLTHPSDYALCLDPTGVSSHRIGVAGGQLEETPISALPVLFASDAFPISRASFNVTPYVDTVLLPKLAPAHDFSKRRVRTVYTRGYCHQVFPYADMSRPFSGTCALLIDALLNTPVDPASADVLSNATMDLVDQIAAYAESLGAPEVAPTPPPPPCASIETPPPRLRTSPWEGDFMVAMGQPDEVDYEPESDCEALPLDVVAAAAVDGAEDVPALSALSSDGDVDETPAPVQVTPNTSPKRARLDAVQLHSPVPSVSAQPNGEPVHQRRRVTRWEHRPPPPAAAAAPRPATAQPRMQYDGHRRDHDERAPHGAYRGRGERPWHVHPDDRPRGEHRDGAYRGRGERPWHVHPDDRPRGERRDVAREEWERRQDRRLRALAAPHRWHTSHRGR